MKKNLLFLVFVVNSFVYAQNTQEFTNLYGDYLGQTPPGDTPVVFAKGVVSTNNNVEFSCVFSPEGTEFYFTRRGGELINNTIMYMKKSGGNWSLPKKADFNSSQSTKYPVIFPDGKKIMFICGGKPGEEYNMVWVSEKSGDNWSTPILLDSPINNKLASYISITKDSSLYFASRISDNDIGIVKSRFQNGKYQTAIPLAPSINTPNIESHPFIAPDESFIIYDSNRPGGFGDFDLYVSYKKKDGSWTEGLNLGPTINTKGWDSCPWITQDGKYFFFSSDGDIYWVDAKILEKYKPNNLNN